VSEPKDYLVVWCREAPVKNLFIRKVGWTGEGDPSNVLALGSESPQPNRNLGVKNVLIPMGSDLWKFQGLYDLPREQWITLPDLPELDFEENESLLGKILFAHPAIKNQEIEDFGVEGGRVVITPRRPVFSADWLLQWRENIRAVEAEYQKQRLALIHVRDPFALIR
jgi:hypothetical protein